MKNLFATAAIALVTFAASASSANTSASSATNSTIEKTSRKIDANNVRTASKAFGVGMYQVKGTESIKLMVETAQKLTVKITDESGNLLNRETIKTTSAMTINLSDAPSGEYFVEISNGIETITRQITKTSASLKTVEVEL